MSEAWVQLLGNHVKKPAVAVYTCSPSRGGWRQEDSGALPPAGLISGFGISVPTKASGNLRCSRPKMNKLNLFPQINELIGKMPSEQNTDNQKSSASFQHSCLVVVCLLPPTVVQIAWVLRR